MNKTNIETDTDAGQSPRVCPKCGDLRLPPWHDQDCDYRPTEQKLELTATLLRQSLRILNN